MKFYIKLEGYNSWGCVITDSQGMPTDVEVCREFNGRFERAPDRPFPEVRWAPDPSDERKTDPAPEAGADPDFEVKTPAAYGPGM